MRISNGPGCCDPRSARPGASPLSSLGRPKGAGAFAPSPAAPPAPPAPSCLPPNLLAECFTGCAGTIVSSLNPPICGWQYIGSDGAGNSVTFNGDTMAISANGGFDATLRHALSGSPLPLNFSGQFRFNEFVVSPDPVTVYEIQLSDAAGNVVMILRLLNNGTVRIARSGDVFYGGFWTPLAAQPRTVHFSSIGGWHLCIDGATVTLIPTITPFGSVIPADTIQVSVTKAGILDTMSFDYAFANDGIDPCATVYCCLDGQPAA